MHNRSISAKAFIENNIHKANLVVKIHVVAGAWKQMIAAWIAFSFFQELHEERTGTIITLKDPIIVAHDDGDRIGCAVLSPHFHHGFVNWFITLNLIVKKNEQSHFLLWFFHKNLKSVGSHYLSLRRIF